MKEQNKIALVKAHEMSIAVQSYLESGNMEMAHRAAAIYQSLMLTILITELIPDAMAFLDSLEKVPTKLPDGTPIQ